MGGKEEVMCSKNRRVQTVEYNAKMHNVNCLVVHRSKPRSEISKVQVKRCLLEMTNLFGPASNWEKVLNFDQHYWDRSPNSPYEAA